MEIPMRQHGRLKLARLSRDRISQRGRDYRVERTVSLFDPYAIQRSKTRCAKGPSCAFESLIAPRSDRLASKNHRSSSSCVGRSGIPTCSRNASL